MNMRISAVTMWLFGLAMMVALVVYLILFYSSPGELSAPHRRAVSGSFINSCRQCHTEEGVDAGCLGCHDEVKDQLTAGEGYHAYLAKEGKTSCKACHPDHLGAAFSLVGKMAWQGEDSQSFSHPHVEFKLEGAHAGLTCQPCHVDKLKKPFVLDAFPDQPRTGSFLGLQQECIHCHDDIHGEGDASRNCQICHNQIVFKPAANFNHDDYFPLKGAHSAAACAACHEQSPDGTVSGFGAVKGRHCTDCHDSPHYSEKIIQMDCIQCHQGDDKDWRLGQRGIDVAVHAAFGFELEKPHADYACKECHDPEAMYEVRFKKPIRSEDQCAVCHSDPHEGQFIRHDSRCLDCHFKERFIPSKIGPGEHTVFTLDGAHRAVACNQCHRIEEGQTARRFADTPERCKACHDNPHGRQFDQQLVSGDCTVCHSDGARTFRISSYKHKGHDRFFLGKSHQEADCRQCHFGRENDEPIVYQTAPTRCSACHNDIHRGQFRLHGEHDCSRCHLSTVNWAVPGFDHERDSRFSLVGSHANVSCSSCHRPAAQPDGRSVIQYKPLTMRCEDCHGFEFQ